MLVLTRNLHERLRLVHRETGEVIEVVYVNYNGALQIQVGIEASTDWMIRRHDAQGNMQTVNLDHEKP